MIHPAKYCGNKIMKFPSLDKEFPSQHRDHVFALVIQWFFIESVQLFDYDNMMPSLSKTTISFKVAKDLGGFCYTK